MSTFFVDTNVFLRFLLQDNLQLARVAKDHFQKAQDGRIALVLIPQVVFEINYILQKVYSLSRKEIAQHLSTLAKSPHLEVEHRDVLIKTLDLYSQTKFDLVDIYLHIRAQKQSAQVLSFDRDLQKLATRTKS